MHKAFLIKLYPNKTQQNYLDKNFGCARFVYNKMLEINMKVYNRRGKYVSKYEMQSLLPKLKKQYPWLKECDSNALQVVCHNLDSSYSKFFKKQGGFPNFKKKNGKQSFMVIQNLELLKNKIKIPKIDAIKFRGGKKPDGIMKKITISKDATGYYASILIENDIEIKKQEIKNVVGVDLGIKTFAVCSNGLEIQNPKIYTKAQNELKKLSQSLAKKQKGSKKRQQAKILLAKKHKKIANQRKDFLNKTANLIVNSCDNQTAIAIEDLAVKNLVKNHQLAKQISDCGWGMFLAKLNNKASDVGKQVIEVGRYFPSSKTCSHCGIVNNNLTLDIREWTCKSCNTNHLRDVNASVNLALEGAKTYYSKGGATALCGDELSLELILKNIKSSIVYEADKLEFKI